MSDATRPDERAFRVLLVDDEPLICRALQHLLQRAGFDVVTASGPDEAEAQLSDAIDAMVLDLRMPRMRGDAFFFMASARFPLLRRRTVFMTGDLSEETDAVIARTGCASIDKPFPIADLIAVLERLLRPPADAPAATCETRSS